VRWWVLELEIWRLLDLLLIISFGVIGTRFAAVHHISDFVKTSLLGRYLTIAWIYGGRFDC
jgi:hypothetical protein